MKSTTTIRRAHPGDIPAILVAWRTLMAAHQAIDPTLYRTAPHAEATYRAFLRRHLDKSGSVVLVALIDGRTLAGYLTGGTGQRAPMFAVREVGMIFDLAVEPAWRRRGVGRALVDQAVEHFRRKGIGYVQVNFDPGNDSASGFWPAQGFRTLLCEAYRPI